MIVSIEEAIDIVLKNTDLLNSEIVPLENAIFKISSMDLKATLPLPSFNNSAMDGYALKGVCDEYKVIGKLLAGDDKDYVLHDGECVKIMTGAVVPPDTQMVIPQENITLNGDSISIDKSVNIGSNIRLCGEDINVAQNVLSVGDVITSAQIALLSSQGITHVEVYKKPRVAVFASGNELKLHYEKIEKSQIYNSNTPYLIARANELNCESIFVGKSEDSVESLVDLIESSLDADLIITSGGVSVGEADFTKEAFKKAGVEILFEKVMIKPGKPTTFGKIGDTKVLNLPGNPLACALNFEVFGKLILSKMSGNLKYHHNYISTKMKQSFIKNRAVDTLLPGIYDGESFDYIKKFSAGMVNVLNKCNGMIVVDKDTDALYENDTVKFLPIEWSFLTKEFINFKS